MLEANFIQPTQALVPSVSKKLQKLKTLFILTPFLIALSKSHIHNKA